MTEIKLGLCKAPEPIYLYVKTGEIEGVGYLWHYYDIENAKVIPELNSGLCGYLKDIQIKEKEFKGKENLKLDIIISADETYIIRTGIDTNFAKAFLFSAVLIKDFSKPLIIACAAGDENVVFCRIYDAQSKTKYKPEWNAKADCNALIKELQGKLGQKCAPKQQDKEGATPHSKDLQIKEIRTLLNYPVKDIKSYLLDMGVNQPSQLNNEDYLQLIKIMCLQWGLGEFASLSDAEDSFNSLVLKKITEGTDYYKTVLDWVNF